MSYLYICNTSADTISKVNLQDFIEDSRIKLGINNADRIGPHGVCVFKENLLVANNFSNSISILKDDKEIESQYIGSHCNDIAVFKNNAYIICGDSNSIIVFDLINKRIVEQITCEDSPHSISFDYKNQKMLVSNMQSDSLTLIDCLDRENIRNIRVGAYPTKAAFSVNGEYIYVCESNLGGYERGNISVISSSNYKVLYKIPVGYSPVDMDCDKDNCYISNFGEGTISIVNVNNYRQVKKINVGGMPRGIKKIGEYLYVGDNYNNQLLQVNILTESKKAINIGGEPTGMAFC
jgi:YVTN family beta-propeller protein